ncbi:hypothetical protein DFH09DRAFT_1363753 [Mycena vulgaris]|nr:hypothetical protein DFH09DRAFT_1363753 [Mycena vulgaris]
MLAGISSRPSPARAPPRHAHRPPACVGRGARLVLHARELPGAGGGAGGALCEAPAPAALRARGLLTHGETLPTPSCAPTASLPCSQHSPSPAFLASASSHGRSGEELAHPILLATLVSPPAMHAHAAHLCAASSNLAALIRHAGHVKELWQWDALDLAWEVVLGALNLAAQPKTALPLLLLSTALSSLLFPWLDSRYPHYTYSSTHTTSTTHTTPLHIHRIRIPRIDFHTTLCSTYCPT